MKYFFNLLLAGLILLFSQHAKAQVVFNEVYGDPGSGYKEYFEFYNTSTSKVPISLDGYNIVTYFEEGTKKGFYVLDLPNLYVGPKGYFVGGPSIALSYQGQSSPKSADFSWNDPNLVAMSGYLKKWVWDGNKNYIEETPIASNFNDFFNKYSGGGSTYSIFVYKNGLLINTLYAGTGGLTTAPSFITSMPNLKTSYVVGNNANAFTINFNSLKTTPAEYVNQNAGINNGFIRLKDGICGTWTKSSTGSDLTPGAQNGTETGAIGVLTLDTRLTRGATAADSSFVTYDIIAGPTDAFPVDLQIYMDNGSISGELDADDQFIQSTTQTNVNSLPATTYFYPQDANIFLVAKSAAGCFDQVIFITDPISGKINYTLPVKLLSFQGSLQNNKAVIMWSVDENETGDWFELEKSIDGKNFVVAGTLFCSEKKGVENYVFKETKEVEGTIYYRLKTINKDRTATYSKILTLKESTTAKNEITLLQNPVGSTLSFNYTSLLQTTNTITIYNALGVKITTLKVNSQKGTNTISIPLAHTVITGTYILEVANEASRSTTRFFKQ